MPADKQPYEAKLPDNEAFLVQLLNTLNLAAHVVDLGDQDDQFTIYLDRYRTNPATAFVQLSRHPAIKEIDRVEPGDPFTYDVTLNHPTPEP